MKNFFNIKKLEIIYFILLLFFATAVNQYYGYLGVYPIDTFYHYDAGYRTLNGNLPIKDYWINSGFLIDFIQALFFKIFGVSWFSYVLHASFFNFLIAIATFFTFNKFELNIHFSFFYSILISVLAYPVSGTPFVDFHSMILSLIGLFSFIVALKTKLNIYWFITPIFLALAFLCKQTPAGYIGLVIAISSIFYFIFNFNLKNLIFLILGTLSFFTLFFIFCMLSKIDLFSMYNQLILFPSSIGKDRLENFLFPLEFNRLILRFKLIHIAQSILIILIIKKLVKNIKYLFNTEFIILFSIIISSYSLIAHQLLTLNQKFIFFIIPILLGFSHIFFRKNFTHNNIVLFFLISFGLTSTLYYKVSYIDNRKFMELENVSLENSIDASLLNKSLKNLKWITPIFPNNPNKEIDLINGSIELIKKDKRNIMLLTSYQFIASIVNKPIYTPNRSHISGISFPSPKNKLFSLYENFFLEQLSSNNIEIIYIIKPAANNFYEDFLYDDCVQQKVLNEILYSYNIINCSY